jgi:hypothetical protein
MKMGPVDFAGPIVLRHCLECQDRKQPPLPLFFQFR